MINYIKLNIKSMKYYKKPTSAVCWSSAQFQAVYAVIMHVISKITVAKKKYYIVWIYVFEKYTFRAKFDWPREEITLENNKKIMIKIKLCQIHFAWFFIISNKIKLLPRHLFAFGPRLSICSTRRLSKALRSKHRKTCIGSETKLYVVNNRSFPVM